MRSNIRKAIEALVLHALMGLSREQIVATFGTKACKKSILAALNASESEGKIVQRDGRYFGVNA